MPQPNLTDTEATVLRAVHARDGTGLYDLSQTVGTGPRAVQEAVQRLAQKDFVHVSGRRVRCTGAGDQWMRQHQ
jgi:predicted transcriptional regulator